MTASRPFQYPTILLSPKTYQAYNNHIFLSDGIVLWKEESVYASNGLGYVLMPGEGCRVVELRGGEKEIT